MATASRAVRVRAHPYLRSVRLAKPQLGAGDEQRIGVRISNPVQEIVIISALVTYPSGEFENLAVGTNTAGAELRWTIPATAGVGEARYSVSAGSGGCCGGDTRKRTFGTVGPVEGAFDLT